MKIKITNKDNEMKLPVDSIVEVKDEDGKVLISKSIGVEFTKEIEDAEKASVIKDEVKNMSSELEVKDGSSIVITKEQPKAKYTKLGDFLSDIINGKLPQYIARGEAWTEKAVTGLNETTNADGGYLVDRPLVDSIYAAAVQGAIIYPKTMKVTVGDKANGAKVPYIDNTGNTSTSVPRGYWLAEGAQKTATKLAFGQHDMTLRKLVFYVPITDEMMEDRVQLESIVMNYVTGKVGWMLDDAILNGTGLATNMIGMFNAAANNFRAACTVANPITKASLINLIGGVLPSFRAGSEWFMGNNVWKEICDVITNSGTVMPSLALLDMAGNTLYGKTVNVMEQCANLDSNGDILFGNFPMGYVCIGKGGIKFDISKDIRFDYDESVLRFVVRVSGAPVIRTQTLVDTSVCGAFSSRF
jgi:HK97 family phage major capsid protein